jgi:hypothetical protein
VQDHCAIEDVAREHPEVCAYEAATFSKVLGRDVQLSRRETSPPAPACVCCVRPCAPATGADRRPDPDGPDPRSPTRTTAVPVGPSGAPTPSDDPPDEETQP